MSTIPSTMKIVVIENKAAVLKNGIPIPEMEGKDLSIKVVAVAGNPTDWKHIELALCTQVSISACDAAGIIFKTGDDLDQNDFAVGDPVYGYIHGSYNHDPKNGAFC